MSTPAVKNVLLIAAALLPTVGLLCLERASTDGMQWLYYVGTMACIIGAAAAIVLREQAKKPKIEQAIPITEPEPPQDEKEVEA